MTKILKKVEVKAKLREKELLEMDRSEDDEDLDPEE